MRWDGLRTEVDEARAAPPLPLALPGAVARTFDTPGFAGMTFYEVQAKSIINKVPGASRVPFEWTINPYRGCGHACTYCLSGDTPILMADGRTRPLERLRPGDLIYGTVERDGRRVYTITEVLDHWSTVKPGYRVRLADGTRLVSSGDHRFLTSRGWRYVAGAPGRPRLRVGDRLAGVGGLGPQARTDGNESADYRRGYLCGAISGQRAVCTEGEVVARIRRYLGEFGADPDGYRYEHGGAGRAATMTLRTSTPIGELTAWPESPTDEWRRGFLAAVFDREGGLDERGTVVGRRDTDAIQLALKYLGFEFTTEPDGAVRLRGGLPASVRFGQLVDPACRSRRGILGRPVGSPRSLTVTAIEPLGLDLPLFDITTGTSDFVAAGVISHNCFARNTHTYLDLDAGHDFDSKVIVKVNAGALLRRELASKRWRGEPIAMGTNVDCYQRAEGRYRLMREILAALRDFANPFSILTKGTLITRDLDLLREAASVTQVGLSMSIGFVDEALWRSVEPGTPSPRRRLDAVRTLTDAGFGVGVLMAPILPGITDDDASMEATVAAIADAGAVSVTPLPLHLRRGAREWYLSWLGRTRPDLVRHYRELFRGGSYSPSDYQRQVTDRVRAMAGRHGIGPRDRAAGRLAPLPPPPPRPEPPVQLTLL
ncbi:intein-containing Rv2578c family radical SAM protein [Rugosimonospora acidiphila]|uniref:Intein-containing Rv2578c family radical SAM protein n=1 Tax=Rugosimonospora acidiphila TaxID=556531 RepID=A0ABP9SAT8_9ACTN